MTKLINLDVSLLGLARVCYEASRAYRKTLGDGSQPSWEEAPEWYKDSAIGRVLFYCENPEATPADCHKSWMNKKLQSGWKFGFLDFEFRQHPRLRPYEELSLPEQAENKVFKGIVKVFMED